MKWTIQNINISKVIWQQEPDGTLLLNRSRPGSLVRIRGNRHPARNAVSVKSEWTGCMQNKTNYNVSKIRSLFLNLMRNEQFFYCQAVSPVRFWRSRRPRGAPPLPKLCYGQCPLGAPPSVGEVKLHTRSSSTRANSFRLVNIIRSRLSAPDIIPGAKPKRREECVRDTKIGYDLRLELVL